MSADESKGITVDAIAAYLLPPNAGTPPQKSGRYAFWAAVAAIVVAAINGGITLVGWSSAESIRKQEEIAKARLENIEQAASRGYQLYARAVERDFIEQVAYGPAVEASGPKADSVQTSAKEYLEILSSLEKDLKPPERQLTVRYLLQGYLYVVNGPCEKAIEALEQYKPEVPAKLHLLAVAYARCKNPSKAAELNNKVRDMPIARPTDRIKAKVIANIGSDYLVGDPPYNEAMRYYEEALKADRTLYEVHYNIAIIHIRRGDIDKALRALCAFKAYYDGDVIRALEQDKDGDFRQFIEKFSRPALEQRISGCGSDVN